MTLSNPQILCHVAFADFTQTPLSALQQNRRLSSALMNTAAKLPEQRQHQFLACRALLAELLAHHYHIPILPDMATHQNSRPQFIDTHLPDFNISHSGNRIAVALTTRGGVGLDIEVKRPRANLLKIAKQCFSINEYDWLISLPLCQQSAGFWQLWTLRESILKLCAKGVWQMKEIEIDPVHSTLSTTFCETLSSYHQQDANLHWSISCHQPMDILLLSQVDEIQAGMTLNSQVFAKNALKIFHYSPNSHR